MSVVELKVGSRLYQVACENGQEPQLLKLASEIDTRIEGLARQMRTGNDSLLLLMTALMMQDELNDAQKKTSNDNEVQARIKKITDDKEAEITDLLNTISGFVESIADKVDSRLP
jgi:cell division protein ZapA